MKTQLFLPLMTYPDQTSETMVSNAIDLAKNLDAVLNATAIDVTIPPITDPWSSLLIDTAKMVAEAEGTSAQRGEQLLTLLRDRCAAEGVVLKSDVISAEQPVCGETAARLSRPYDLVLLEGAPAFGAVTEEVIFGAGRPVILYPDRISSGRIEHVAIAWDGSRAAARALGDASAFINAATQVSVLYALDEKPIEHNVGEQLIDVLRSRGANVTARPLHTYERPIGDVLQSNALQLKADLLVMGAYGHSRFREFVLGGATSDVLSGPLLPIFMSH